MLRRHSCSAHFKGNALGRQEELRLAGDRLHYKLLRGSRPFRSFSPRAALSCQVRGRQKVSSLEGPAVKAHIDS